MDIIIRAQLAIKGVHEFVLMVKRSDRSVPVIFNDKRGEKET